MPTNNVRLHITPFTPDFATSIISTTLAKEAENISFHALPTFPENSYGFVDLPPTEAEKLKKRLNGAILRGKKIRIEKARPPKRPIEEVEQALNAVVKTSSSPALKRIKRREGDGTSLYGYEMPEDRKVKRGWTEPRRKERKKQKSSSTSKETPASKFTDKEECLFRTKVPENKQEAKGTQNDLKKKKIKKHKGQELVHEFRKTTVVPSFLRDTNPGNHGKAIEFIEGKGWVDEDGHVIENAPEAPRRSQIPAQVPYKRKHDALIEPEDHNENISTSESGIPRYGVSDPISLPSRKQDHLAESTASSDVESTPSSSVDATSSEGDDSETASSAESDARSDVDSESDSEEVPKINVSQPTSLSLEESETVASPLQPHPLEVLFKRPGPAADRSQDVVNGGSKPSLEISTSFSFFDPDMEESEPNLPMTPFTSQERRYRDLRSAAPTPDTAAPSRTSFFPGGSQPESASEGDEDDFEDTLVNVPTQASPLKTKIATDVDGGVNAHDTTQDPKGTDQSSEQSEFVKWFYEHRGENNRLWKRRRREAAKEKRREDNRKAAKSARRHR